MVRSIAIVGAGIAGLACARALRAADRSEDGRARLFDKGRSPGGRVATRRVETTSGTAQFDHGAQFFTARDPGFVAALGELDTKASMPWDALKDRDGRVSAPGMSALPKAFAQGLDIVCATQVVDILGARREWSLKAADGKSLGVFDAVIIATPAEQAAPLLAGVALCFAEEARAAVTAPCWTGLFAVERAVASNAMAFDLKDHPVLGWLACDSAKPGRADAPSCWVAQANAEWTRAHLEQSPEEVAPLLLDATSSVLGVLPAPLVMQAHRWRYAKVECSAPTPFAWDGDLGIGVCGDWRIGPRVECAWMSGDALGRAMLA